MSATHRLERRAQMLASRLTEQRDALRDAVAPPGSRLPFRTALPKTQALAWWTRHRHDDLGQKVLATWPPDEVAALDGELARHSEAAALGTGPVPNLGDGTIPPPAA